VLIGSTSLSFPASGALRRDGAFDSAQPTRPAPGADEQPAGRGEITRLRPRASDAIQDDSRFSDLLQNLPARSRNALQSYLSNGPSIQERLGVELAGVDVFA